MGADRTHRRGEEQAESGMQALPKARAAVVTALAMALFLLPAILAATHAPMSGAVASRVLDAGAPLHDHAHGHSHDEDDGAGDLLPGLSSFRSYTAAH